MKYRGINNKLIYQRPKNGQMNNIVKKKKSLNDCHQNNIIEFVINRQQHSNEL